MGGNGMHLSRHRPVERQEAKASKTGNTKNVWYRVVGKSQKAAKAKVQKKEEKATGDLSACICMSQNEGSRIRKFKPRTKGGKDNVEGRGMQSRTNFEAMKGPISRQMLTVLHEHLAYIGNISRCDQQQDCLTCIRSLQMPWHQTDTKLLCLCLKGPCLEKRLC